MVCFFKFFYRFYFSLLLPYFLHFRIFSPSFCCCVFVFCFYLHLQFLFIFLSIPFCPSFSLPLRLIFLLLLFLLPLPLFCISAPSALYSTLPLSPTAFLPLPPFAAIYLASSPPPFPSLATISFSLCFYIFFLLHRLLLLYPSPSPVSCSSHSSSCAFSFSSSCYSFSHFQGPAQHGATPVMSVKAAVTALQLTLEADDNPLPILYGSKFGFLKGNNSRLLSLTVYRSHCFLCTSEFSLQR